MEENVRPRKSTIVIGKIHISEWVKSELDKKIIDLVSSGEMYKQDWGRGKNKFVWAFGDHVTKDINGEKIIFARLGKIKAGFEDLIYDKKAKSFKRVTVETKPLYYSNLIISPKSHIIIFEERPGISASMFPDLFSKFYSEHFNDLSSLKIDLILDREIVFSRLNDFDKIIEVKFKVMPSNPDNEEEFRKLDEEIKNSNASEASFKFKNEQDGLKVKDSMVGQGIALSGAGYGEYTIVGVEEDGEKKVIKSKDQVLRQETTIVDEPGHIITYFLDILRKFKK
jgi:hypothetical protein